MFCSACWNYLSTGFGYSSEFYQRSESFIHRIQSYNSTLATLCTGYPFVVFVLCSHSQHSLLIQWCESSRLLHAHVHNRIEQQAFTLELTRSTSAFTFTIFDSKYNFVEQLNSCQSVVLLLQLYKKLVSSVSSSTDVASS